MAMRYTLLGRTGLRVSELCLGTGTFGTDWGWGADEAESRRVFDAYVEVGVTFFDTAANYGAGHSEDILGRALAGRRREAVIATKFGFDVDEAGKRVTRFVHDCACGLRAQPAPPPN